MLSQNNSSEIACLAQQLGAALRHCGAKVSTAESCTGGGIAEAITSVSGSSQWFDCGYVVYANSAKQRLLGVDAELLNKFGAVSEQVVQQMAAGAIKASQADYAVAVSGIAGPDGGTADKPVGTVWFCWIGPSGTYSKRFLLKGERLSVREQAVKISLHELLHQIGG